jgi:predicted kinase
MRRLPAGRDALSLLEAGCLVPEQLDALARLVALFHRRPRLSPAAHATPAAWRARCLRPVRDNFVLLAHAARGPRPVVPPGLLRRASALAARFAREEGARFHERWRERRGVDGHGDLHLQHVFFEDDDAPPLLIDCIEFRADLRRIDAAAEVAFLAMDLRYRGRADLAERFLAAYAAAADDFGLYGVVDFFLRYRAAVRGKVASVAAADLALPAAQRRAAAGSARRHVALAARPRIVRGPGALVLTCGQVGSGKSSVAREAARRLSAVTISSDVVRKAGGRVAYDERAKGAIYRGLLARAEPVVASGRIAILDATFDRRARRRLAARWAARHGVPALLLEVRCDPAVARARLARRAAEGRDPSDAGPAEQAASAARFQPPEEWPASRRRVVRTDAPWRAALARALRGLVTPRGRARTPRRS